MFLSVNIKYPFDSALYLPVNAHITAICAFQTVILRNMDEIKRSNSNGFFEVIILLLGIFKSTV